ncbi:hypothetical protein I4U23_002186 [Adineta vaga]|nr:hypothetical protein I4U23_002186 [Adineta vaga]
MSDRNNIRQNSSLIYYKWSKRRFYQNKLLHTTSRYLIAISINHLLERNQRKLNEQNDDIYQSIEQINEHLDILEEKFNTLDNICLFLDIPPRLYFEERMMRLRHSTKQYLDAIEQEIHEEVEHWKNIHSVLSQPLLETGLIRSYYGGLPRQVQQSPSSELNTICEENETIKLPKKPNRSLASINTFSILSNMNVDENLLSDRFNKTFVIDKSSTSDLVINDENLTSTKLHNMFTVYRDRSDLENDAREDSIIYID